MEGLRLAAEQAVRNCMRLRPKDKMVLIYDEAAISVAVALFNVAYEINGTLSKEYCMESYGERDDPRNPLKFPSKIRQALKEADVSFMVKGKTPRGERESFTRPMLNIVDTNKKLRHAHMPGITENTFISGMSADYLKLKKLTARVKKLASKANQIHVTTPAGSDFIGTFKKHRWVISAGFIGPDEWHNLPGSETYTCPANLEGKIVVDGVLGDDFDQKYGMLERNPLILEAEGGRIVSINCSNKELKKEFKKYISKDENANRFGEFAIGTNIGLEKLLGNMLHDEKFPGVHIAVGHPYPKETGAKWDSNVHCDMVMRQCNIYVDGKKIMSKGKFLPEILQGI